MQCWGHNFGAVHRVLVYVRGQYVALVYGAGLGGGEKKCACHLIGTQATDIVSRDEQWPHTSPTHYLLLLLLAYHLRLLLDFLYPPMAHNLP